MANLNEGMIEQLARARELKGFYEEIGPAGAFGMAFITAAIEEGEQALASQDVVRMLAAYKGLESLE